MRKNKKMNKKVLNIRLTQVNLSAQEIFHYLLETYLSMLDELIQDKQSFSRWRLLFDKREDYIIRDNLRNIQAILLKHYNENRNYRTTFIMMPTSLQKIFICLFYNLEEDLIITSPEGVQNLWENLLNMATDNSKEFSLTLNFTRSWMRNLQTDGEEES